MEPRRMSASSVLKTPDFCIIKDSPDDPGPCRKPKHTTVWVRYRFGEPYVGEFEFELPMCEGHAAAMMKRVEVDLLDVSMAQDED